MFSKNHGDENPKKKIKGDDSSTHHGFFHKKTFKVQEILDASQNMYLVPMVQCIKAFICPAFIGSAIFQQLRHLTTAAADGPNPSAADGFKVGLLPATCRVFFTPQLFRG